MNKCFKFLIVHHLFLVTVYVQGQEKITIGEKRDLFSKILNEKRDVWIHLPKSYTDESSSPAKYPVIYLLDAEINFEYYAPMTDFISKNPYAEIPECIVVGIKNTDRTRDLTPTKSSKKSPEDPNKMLFENSGGSENFIRFIQEELKPFIHKNYRTENYSVVVGHSFGGLFVIYTLLSHPDYFNAYVANDPSLWWDQQVLIAQTKTYLAKNKNFSANNSLYVSQADNKEQNKNWNSDMTLAIRDFKKIIEENGSLKYKHRFYEDEVHGTVSYLANYDALKFIFNGFRTDIKEIVRNPLLLEQHYQMFSEKMGISFIPSESYLNMIISFMKNNNANGSEVYYKNLKNKLYSK